MPVSTTLFFPLRPPLGKRGTWNVVSRRTFIFSSSSSSSPPTLFWDLWKRLNKEKGETRENARAGTLLDLFSFFPIWSIVGQNRKPNRSNLYISLYLSGPCLYIVRVVLVDISIASIVPCRIVCAPCVCMCTYATLQ